MRRESLSHLQAADKLIYLMKEARSRQLSGVALKDEAPPAQAGTATTSFLIAP